MRAPRSGPYSHSYPGDDRLLKALALIAAVVTIAFAGYWDATHDAPASSSPLAHECNPTSGRC